MKALGWAVAIALTILLAANIVQGRDAEGFNRAERERLEADSRAKGFALDTLKARNAEREVRDQKHADSLRRVIATFKGRVPVIVHDTVRLPVAEYVFLTDTLIPKCEACAARLDSAVLAARAEREAATLLHHSQSVRLGWWQKQAESETRRRKRAEWIAPTLFLGGAVLGAWLRGQP